MVVFVRGTTCYQHSTERCGYGRMIAANRKAKCLCEEIASRAEVNLPWAVLKQPKQRGFLQNLGVQRVPIFKKWRMQVAEKNGSSGRTRTYNPSV